MPGDKARGERGPLSLRQHLLLRLLPSVVLLIAFGAAFSYLLALKFANLAYDRSLLDSARSLATQVKLQQGHATFNLPREAFEIFEWDEIDRTYYQVSSTSAGLLAGNRDLPLAVAQSKSDDPVFFDATYREADVRGVQIRDVIGDEAVTIAVAETTRKRRNLAGDILAVAVLPQIALILLVSFLVWTGVKSGLRSLVDVTTELEGKDHRDLSPLDVSRVPRELATIVGRMNQLLARLRSAMDSQRQFIAEAAHQLRTPLAGLKLQSDNLLRSAASEPVREAATQMKATADRAVRLGNQLLTLARAEPEFNATRSFADVDLVAIARDAGANWIPLALARGVDIEFDAPAQPVRIHGDATLLGEMVNNLVDNAVRYGRAQGTVRIVVSGPRPTICVEDDGPGIAEELRDRVFDRFYRTPDASSTGSGLGLAIVREIAELHGGSASIASRPEYSGTRVCVELGGEDLNGGGHVPR